MGAALTISHPHHWGFACPAITVLLSLANLIYFSSRPIATDECRVAGQPLLAHLYRAPNPSIRGAETFPWSDFNRLVAAACCLPASGPSFILLYRSLVSCVIFPDFLISLVMQRYLPARHLLKEDLRIITFPHPSFYSLWFVANSYFAEYSTVCLLSTCGNFVYGAM